MNYLELLRPDVELTVRPLVRKVASIRRQTAAILKREAAEKEHVTWTEARLAELKADAPQRLTESQASYGRWKSEVKVLTGRLQASREACKMFAIEILPSQQTELETTLKALGAATATFCRNALPACQSRMSELLAQVVAERDSFEVAVAQFELDYGTTFTRDVPKAACDRLDRVEHFLGAGRLLSFLPQPAAERAAALALLAGPPVANVAPAALVAPAVHLKTPMISTVTETPLDGPSDSPDAPQDGQDTPQVARDAAKTRETGRQIDADEATRPRSHTPLTGEPTLPENGPDFLSGKPAARDYAEAPDALPPDAGAGAALDAADDEAQDAAAFDADADLDAPDVAAGAEAPPAPDEKKI